MITKFLKFQLVGMTLLMLSSTNVFAEEKRKLCVFDILGTAGDVYNLAKDYVFDASKHGVAFELEGYSNEQVASEDFKIGRCDALFATSFRTRQYNLVASSMDAIGAASIVRNGKTDIQASYEVVHKAIALFASPQAASLMSQDKYEIAGIVPFGAAFLFVKDRSMNSVEKMAGKKIATFDNDKAQSKMVQRIGAQPVSADIMNFATKFNNGSVDMIGAPAAAYKPLELHRGLGSKGAIIRFPVGIATYQLVIYKDKFPSGFAQKSREYWFTQFDRAKKMASSAEKAIPASAWEDIPSDDITRYNIMMRDARIDTAKEGIYSAQTLNIMKKIRCRVNSSDAECSSPSEL